MQLFKNATSVEGVHIDLSELLDGIKKGKWKDRIDYLRNADKEEQDYYKKTMLPAISISCDFEGTRAKRNATNHSGILQVDIDKCVDPLAVKNWLINDPHVMFCFISPRGNGVKAGVKIPADIDLHKESFIQFTEYIKPPVGWDEAVKDVSRLCFVSYDPDIYINLNCEEFEVVKKIKVPAKNIIPVRCESIASERTAQKTMDTCIREICSMSNGTKHSIRNKVGFTLGGGISGGYWSEYDAINMIEPYVRQTSTIPDQAMRYILKSIEDGKGRPLEPSKGELNLRKAKARVAEEYKSQTGEELTEDVSNEQILSSYFIPLGLCGDTHCILNMKKGLVSEIPIIKKDHLTDLADLDYWESIYSDPQSETVKINWDRAISDLMGHCREAGFYNPDRVRGRGVWVEGENIIVNTGKDIYCNGVKRVSQDKKSKYIYSRGSELDLSYSGEIASVKDSEKFYQIFLNLPIEKTLDGLLLAGWSFIAPIAGGLEWRPHIWICAPSGTGKTWINNNVLLPSFGNISLKVLGEETTEAGIRQAIKADALVVIHDEAEASSEKGKRNIEAKLMLARQSSTESEAKVYKGSVGGKSMSFTCRSQFMFISTSMPVLNRADSSRITVIRLVPSSERKNGSEQFKTLSELVKSTMSEQYCSSIRTRAIHFLPKIRQASKVFNSHICDKVKSQRDADQFSPMVAGAWFLLNDDIPDDFEAEIFLSAFDFPCFDNADTEEEKCIDSVLSLIPKEWATTMTIGEAINKMIHNLDDTIKPILEQIGIGYSKKKNAIHFKTNNIVLSSILREKNSPFFATYIEELSRLKGAVRNEGHNYSGRVCKGVYVPIEALNIKKDEEVLQW